MSEESKHYKDEKPKDIKRTLRTCIHVARRAGYRIDAEVHSMAGLVVAEALTDPRAETYDFIYYCCMVLIQRLSLFKPVMYEEFNLDKFVERLPAVRDNAQQLLMRIREPDRSVCFAIWIEGKRPYEVTEMYGVSWAQIQTILKRTQKILLDTLDEDGHYAIRKNPGEFDTIRTVSVRRHSGDRRPKQSED